MKRFDSAKYIAGAWGCGMDGGCLQGSAGGSGMKLQQDAKNPSAWNAASIFGQRSFGLTSQEERDLFQHMYST